MEKLKISKSSWHYRLAHRYLGLQVASQFKLDKTKIISGDKLIQQNYSTICSYGSLVFWALVNVIWSILLVVGGFVISLFALGFALHGLGSATATNIPVLVFSTNTFIMGLAYILYGVIIISVVIGSVVGMVLLFKLLIRKISEAKTTSVDNIPQSQKTNLVKEMILAKFGKYCKRIDFK